MRGALRTWAGLLFAAQSILNRGTEFEPHRSLSPDGQFVLDVTIDPGEGPRTTFAGFFVLDAKTEAILYECPDSFRIWDLSGIDWQADGTVLVDSSDTGKQRYGPGASGAWAELR